MKQLKLTCLTIIFVGMVLFLSTPVWAVTGNCANCHTMHNSQGGIHMILNTDIDGTSGGAHGGGYPSLTRGSCVGCHTGTNSGGSRPFVYNTSEPTYGTDTLAGGNFYWAIANDAKGHNVKGIPGMTADTLSEAPGNPYTCANSCHLSLFNAQESGVALITGCQGCHLEPKHHAPQQAVGAPALAANGYFRFLSGHQSGTGFGVEGIEDADWQYTKGATDHNEYLGHVGDHENAAGFYNLNNTMTAYCCGCHGNFHWQRDGAGASANWIRHPSDAVLPNTGEYTDYTTYDPGVPVARPNLGTIADTGLVANNADMVMCLSCHRAHGSPNDDMLRWDYSGMVAGNGGAATGTGCFKCHSEKD
jgi:hypothetical protein